MTHLKAILAAARAAIAGLAAGILAASLPAEAQRLDTPAPTVFAAASMKTALDSLSADYLKSTGKAVTLTYAGSSALAKQIEQAAPADIFISADEEWMDYLAKKSLINPATRSDLIGNELVLIAPVDSKVAIDIAEGFKLAEALGEGRLAVGDVKAVPAGKYAKSSLTALKIWDSVESKLAQSENVRAALTLVARGEAPLGIVYRSDAAAEPKVKVIGTFPAATHAPIIYPIAVVAGSKVSEASRGFIDYLKSEAAQKAFLSLGFTALK